VPIARAPKRKIVGMFFFSWCIYLVNSKELLKLKSFIKASYNKCVKASFLSFSILRYSKKVIKKALNSIASLNLKDLTLSDIIVIKGFYINIVFKARLNKVKV
jgi:hypothetical protein